MRKARNYSSSRRDYRQHGEQSVRERVGDAVAHVRCKVLLELREDVRLVDASQGLAFAVRVVEPMGSHLLLTGQVGGERIRVVAAPQAEIASGMTLGLQLDAARVVVMDTQTGKAL